MSVKCFDRETKNEANIIDRDFDIRFLFVRKE